MKQIPKPVLIFLIVILVIFVLGVALGATHGGNEDGGPRPTFSPPGWVEGLGPLGSDRPVSLDDVSSSSCPMSDAVFQVPGSCLVSIEGSDHPVRHLQLRLESPVIVTLSLVPQGEGEEAAVERTLSGLGAEVGTEDAQSLDVLSEGATLTIGCNATPCRLRLLE